MSKKSQKANVTDVTIHGMNVVDYLDHFVKWWDKWSTAEKPWDVPSPDIEGARKIIKMCRPLPDCANEG